LAASSNATQAPCSPPPKTATRINFSRFVGSDASCAGRFDAPQSPED